ncbi:MAG: helix-turn-helix transcriptional regulator [Oscillospiraceae bacterium]|nr:helix-turn-helix transcriptional regulator [Oscillospiraceae bacterium]
MRSATDTCGPDRVAFGNKAVNIEAPGEFLSGLLGVLSIEQCAFNTGEVAAFPAKRTGWQIVAPLSGKIHLTAGEQVWPVAAPQAAVQEGTSEFSILSIEASEVALVSILGHVADRVFASCRREGGLFFERGGIAVARLLQQLTPGHGRQTRAKDASEAAYQLLMALLDTGLPSPGKGRQLPQVVEAALGLMHGEYAFLEGISELAGRLEVSEEYLIRSFRRYMGTTPGDYLNRVRIENAKTMLRSGEYSVQFVSDACGFSNSNYFARVFRARVGMNPGEYVREQRTLRAGESGNLQDVDDSLYVL